MLWALVKGAVNTDARIVRRQSVIRSEIGPVGIIATGVNYNRHPAFRPPKPRQIVTVPWNVDACTILPQPLNPSTLCRRSPRARSTRSIGDPLGLDRLERLESIDRGSPRARSTRIDRESLRGDPLGLDRIGSDDFCSSSEGSQELMLLFSSIFKFFGRKV